MCGADVRRNTVSPSYTRCANNMMPNIDQENMRHTRSDHVLPEEPPLLTSYDHSQGSQHSNASSPPSAANSHSGPPRIRLRRTHHRRPKQRKQCRRAVSARTNPVSFGCSGTSANTIGQSTFCHQTMEDTDNHYVSKRKLAATLRRSINNAIAASDARSRASHSTRRRLPPCSHCSIE